MDKFVSALFSNHRREFIARAILDVVKLGFGAAFVSDFFIKYSNVTRALLGIMLFGCITVAGLFFPEKGAKS